MLKQLVAKMFDSIYPRKCPVCHDIVMPKGQLICPMCVNSLPVVTGSRCVCCSKHMEEETQEFCQDCAKMTHEFLSGYAAFLYDDCMQQSITRFKYHGRKEYGCFYAREVVFRFRMQIARWGAQVLVPVPLHPSKRRIRGYNQAGVLAKEMGKLLGLPVWEDALLRVRRTKPQKQLDDKERRQNLKGAFAINPQMEKAVRGLHTIILIDDIYTTGSTLDACARACRNAGVKQVYFLTVCIGSGY